MHISPDEQVEAHGGGLSVAEPSKASVRYDSLPMPSLRKDNATRFFESTLSRIAAAACRTNQLRIAQVVTPPEVTRLRAARLAMYRGCDSYFGKLTNKDGSDDLDFGSYLFAAYVGDAIVGTIRLTPSPFEASKYIDTDRLADFLGREKLGTYLEISRLVTDRTCQIPGLGRALIVYAGLLTCLSTNYERYVAIARPALKEKSFNFKLDSDALSFRIPQRGEHEYHLLKGSFVADFYDIFSQNVHVLQDAFESGKVAHDQTFCSF